jgi:hypothetical protein
MMQADAVTRVKTPTGRSMAVVMVLLVLAGLFVSVSAGDLYTLLFFLPYAIPGLILQIRRPDNSIGRLLIGIGWACALATLRVEGDRLALTQGTAPVVSRLVAWGTGFGWPAALALLFMMTLIFPSGHLPNRHRYLSVTAIVLAVFSVLLVALAPTIEVAHVLGDTVTLLNPLSLYPSSSFWAVGPSEGALFTINLALLGAGVVLIVARYMRARGTERLQLRWLTSAVIVASVGTVVGFAIASVTGNAAGDPRTSGPGLLVAWLPAILGIVAIPVAIALAVLRYHLYDIDTVISRTVGYSLVLLALGAVYLAGAVWLPTRLVGHQPPLAVAGATLAVAALFNPLRARILHRVDRRFDRSRYSSELVAANFSDRVRDEIDPDQLRDDLVEVVSDTMHPSTLGVWVKS